MPNVLDFKCPPGFRFCPYDEELILHYLLRRVKGQPLPVNGKIIDVDIYKFNPEVLSERYKQPGETVCYFFTSTERKYPNGSRAKRAAGDGHWKATTAMKPIIYKGKTVGYKRSLKFFRGKSPSCDGKTNWIMHEFTLNQAPRTNSDAQDIRLEDYVLCRIYSTSDGSKRTRSQSETDTNMANDDAGLISQFDVAETNVEDQLMNDIVDSQSHVYTNPTCSVNYQPSYTISTCNVPYQPSYTSPTYGLPRHPSDQYFGNVQMTTDYASYSEPTPPVMMPVSDFSTPSPFSSQFTDNTSTDTINDLCWPKELLDAINEANSQYLDILSHH